jgi:hypothetical protein
MTPAVIPEKAQRFSGTQCLRDFLPIGSRIFAAQIPGRQGGWH